MAREEYLFTSESVTEGHPDKIADQISDAVLDAILAQDPVGRVACETLLTTGLVVVAGEVTTSCYVDIPKIVRSTICNIGYTSSDMGYDGNTCGVMVAIEGQSQDIARGVAPSRRRALPRSLSHAAILQARQAFAFHRRRIAAHSYAQDQTKRGAKDVAEDRR